jgi:hypothetical protein
MAQTERCYIARLAHILATGIGVGLRPVKLVGARHIPR